MDNYLRKNRANFVAWALRSSPKPNETRKNLSTAGGGDTAAWAWYNGKEAMISVRNKSEQAIQVIQGPNDLDELEIKIASHIIAIKAKAAGVVEVEISEC